MPELPEVETMRRGILGSIGGKITAIEKVRCRKKPIEMSPSLASFKKRVIGKTILDIDRIGKRVVICIGQKQPAEFLIFEPRMTGLVLVANPPTQEHLRFGMSLGKCDIDQILYWDRRGLGKIRLLNPAQLAEQLGPQKIGPDALKISESEFAERFSQPNREIKVALLDQKLVAGVGNLYASELLHAAKIHPQRKCCELNKSQLKRVFEEMRKVLKLAIRYEGSTLADGTYRNALNKAGGFQNHHQVYDQAGQRCVQCNRSKIQRIVQAQRSTFYCRNCQRA